MPGLVGFVKSPLMKVNAEKVMFAMREQMNHRKFYKTDIIFEDESICSSRNHKNIEQCTLQPLVKDNTYVWLDGEFYNYPEKNKNLYSDPGYLLESYVKYDFSEFVKNLKQINGVYSAVIYDSVNKMIHLISDQFGLKPLYWFKIAENFVWASEVKCFLEYPYFNIKINSNSIQNFMNIGYMQHNQTWFENVELLPHATIITYDIAKKVNSVKHYWDFDEVRILENIDANDIIDQMSKLFKNAVNRNCESKHKYGISLSGGLDSRAILAAVPENAGPIHSITFGNKGCQDSIIAEKIAALKGADHHFFELTSENWFYPRLEGIWVTDGHLNLMFMHGIEYLQFEHSMSDIELNGFIGDAVLGGSLLGKIPYKTSFLNRIRRNVRTALNLAECELHVRAPFVDKDLMEFSLGIQLYLHNKWFLYSKMLIRDYPEYFNNIPWEKTGFPINISYNLLKLLFFKDRAINKLKRTFKMRHPICTYAKYEEWLRHEPAYSFLQDALSGKKSISKDYIDPLQIKTALESLDKSNDEVLYIFRCLTFEIWLQQIFEKRFRNDSVSI